jgi:hypothetical protein
MRTEAAVPEAGCPDPGRDLAQVRPGDIVRLKKPFVEKIDRQKVPFPFGIVAEIVAVLPDGRPRNVGLYLYDPGRKEILLGPYGTPAVLDYHCSEIELYKRATDDSYPPLIQPTTAR